MKINSIDNQTFKGKPVFKNRQQLVKYRNRTKTIEMASGVAGLALGLATMNLASIATFTKLSELNNPVTNKAFAACLGLGVAEIGLSLIVRARNFIARKAKNSMGPRKKQCSRISRHKKFELKAIYEQAVSRHQKKLNRVEQ